MVEIILEASEAAELAAALQVVTDHPAVDESPAGDSAGVVDERSPITPSRSTDPPGSSSGSPTPAE
jgi:hypothetical protein